MATYRFAIWVIALVGVLAGQPNTLLAQSLKTPEFQEGATKASIMSSRIMIIPRGIYLDTRTIGLLTAVGQRF